MSEREKRERRNKYMANYKQGKKSHYIALNDRMTEKEMFLLGNKERGIEPRVNLKFNEIYERGLDEYMKDYKKTSNRLQYKLQCIREKQEELKKQLAKLEIEEKEVEAEIKEDERYKNQTRLRNWVNGKIKKEYENFVKKQKQTGNEDIGVREFYKTHKNLIWKEYTKSAYKNSVLDNTMLDEQEKDFEMVDVLSSVLLR